MAPANHDRPTNFRKTVVVVKKKILIIQPLHPKALAILEARKDVAYEIVTDFTEANLLKVVRQADAITVRDAPLSKNVIEQAASVRVISRHGVGYDNIPIEFCTQRNVPVTVVGPVNAVSVAEHTLFLLLGAARSGIVLDKAVRVGNFAARSNILGKELHGKKLLLIGYGRIGREVARRAAALGLQILVYDPFFEGGADVPITIIGSLDAALEQADAVSLHIPLSDKTRNILGARELAILPKGAIVVNASRGGLIDEAALVNAVRAGALHGAGIDTFEVEPLPPSSPLTQERRIVLSPHSAALTDDALIAMGTKTVENALAGLDGSLDPELVVNKGVLECRT